MISNSEMSRINTDARSFYDAYMEVTPKQEKLFKDRIKKYQAIQEKARKSNTAAFAPNSKDHRTDRHYRNGWRSALCEEVFLSTKAACNN